MQFMRRPKLTLPQVLVVTAILSLALSMFIISFQEPYHYVTDSVPPEIAYKLQVITNATEYYSSDTGRYPRTLEDLSTYPVLRASYAGDDRIADLSLEGIHYTPEFLGMIGPEQVILAYAPVEGKEKWAVCFVYPTELIQGPEIVMRSEEELQNELKSLRQMLSDDEANK